MNFINIRPADQPPMILNVDHISSLEQWIDPATSVIKGTVIRMATIAAREDLQAPVKHVTPVAIGALLGKLTQAGARLIP